MRLQQLGLYCREEVLSLEFALGGLYAALEVVVEGNVVTGDSVCVPYVISQRLARARHCLP